MFFVRRVVPEPKNHFLEELRFRGMVLSVGMNPAGGAYVFQGEENEQ